MSEAMNDEVNQACPVPGIYRIHWGTGDFSLASIFMDDKGRRWLAPTNWVRPGLLRDVLADISRLERLPADSDEPDLAPAPQPQGVNGNPDEPKADGRLRIEPCESWGKHVLQFWNGKGWETLHTDYLKIVERMQEQLSRLTSGDAAERERNLEGVEYLGSCGAGRAALADIQRSREEDLSEKLAAAENTIASQRTELARLNREYERQIKVAAAHANLESAATERLAAAQHDLGEARARLLTAAGDDLCRLSQEEIKAMSLGKVKIPPKDEFLASCERFHAQVAGEVGVNHNCLTLAQLVAENERQRLQLAEARRALEEIAAVTQNPGGSGLAYALLLDIHSMALAAIAEKGATDAD